MWNYAGLGYTKLVTPTSEAAMTEAAAVPMRFNLPSNVAKRATRARRGMTNISKTNTTTHTLRNMR